MTLTFRVLEASICPKYLAAMDGLTPTCSTNIPIGSFEKCTSTEKVPAVGNVLGHDRDCRLVPAYYLGREHLVAPILAIHCRVDQGLGEVVQLDVDDHLTPDVGLAGRSEGKGGGETFGAAVLGHRGTSLTGESLFNLASAAATIAVNLVSIIAVSDELFAITAGFLAEWAS